MKHSTIVPSPHPIFVPCARKHDDDMTQPKQISLRHRCASQEQTTHESNSTKSIFPVYLAYESHFLFCILYLLHPVRSTIGKLGLVCGLKRSYIAPYSRSAYAGFWIHACSFCALSSILGRSGMGVWVYSRIFVIFAIFMDDPPCPKRRSRRENIIHFFWPGRTNKQTVFLLTHAAAGFT